MKIGKIFIILLVFWGIMIPVVYGEGMVSADCVTNNGIFVVTNKVDANVRWMWIQVLKDRKESDYYFEPMNGGFSKPISLKFGPGKYGVNVWQSMGQRQSEYQFCYGFSVINTDKSVYYDAVSNDSSVVFRDRMVPGDVQWLWIRSMKDGKESEAHFQPSNGGFEKKAYLKFGPGQYQVEIWGTDGPLNGNYWPCDKFAVFNRDGRDLAYLLPMDKVECNSPVIMNLAAQITQFCASDLAKTKAIHDWIATHIAYDTNEIFSGYIHESSALETLDKGMAICNGYVNLAVALNRAAGIRTRLVAGVAYDYISKDQAREILDSEMENHVWIETWIDGQWISQDACWDAGRVNEATRQFEFRYSDRYFNPDVVFFNSTHRKTKENND